MTTIPSALAGNVVLEGYIDVPAHRVDAIIDALPQHIALTRAEVGCRYFDVTADASIDGRFNVYEIFEGRSAFEMHQTRASASPWAAVTAGIDRHYVVTDVAS